MIYWYNIRKISEGYIVVKNVESRNAIGSGRKFFGTKKECMDYCKNKNIELNKKYKGDINGL